jgi:uncharacterized membrane-anchored protein
VRHSPNHDGSTFQNFSKYNLDAWSNTMADPISTDPIPTDPVQSEAITDLAPLSPLPSTSPATPVEPPLQAPSWGQKMANWRFWVPMVIQSAFIVMVPFQSAMTYATGQTVTLQTVPVDPYDLLRGYSQTLRYEISDRQTLASLAGGKEVFSQDLSLRPTRFYVILEAPTQQTSPPAAWKPVRVSRTRPKDLPSNQIALQGRDEWQQIVYGLETYYMPEAQRKDINSRISQLRSNSNQGFVVDVRIDARGRSVPDSLWLGDRQYRF